MTETWIHPTGSTPKTVTLICLGPSRGALTAGFMESDFSEAVLGADEVWTLNRGVKAFPHDLLWVMDHIQGEADKFPRYGAALWQHDKPIITSDNCEGWPAHVRKFPFNEVWNWLAGTLNPQHGNWFHNSVAYILVYAAFIGVREIRVFGADYSGHSSGVVEDGHPNVAYWAGKLEAAGLAVKVPQESTFLGASHRGWIYGYQSDPRVIPANRARFRALVGGEPDPDSTALLSGERQVAPDVEQIQPDHVARYQWAAAKIDGDRMLELGSGIGYGSALLCDAGAREVIGLELSQGAIDYAREHYAKESVVWYQADLDGRTVQTAMGHAGNFDSATAFEIIEHLADPAPMLASLPARRLFASVPNEAVIPYSPETAPFHQRHYTGAQFGDLLKRCGWKVVEWRGQAGPQSPVTALEDTSRTLVVEAVRCED